MKDIWNQIKSVISNKWLCVLWTILLLVVGAWLTTYMVQYLLLEPELFDKLSDAKWMLNRGCVLVVYLLILCVTNHVGLSAIISHGLFMVLAFINYYVYLFRENEFIFADIRSIGTGLSVAGKYQLELHERGWQVLLASLLFMAMAGLFRIRFKRAFFLRLLSGLTAVWLCLLISIETDGMTTQTWEQKGSYQNGYVLNFLLSARDSFVAAPGEYDVEVIGQLEKDYAGKQESSVGSTLSKKPTIIVVMNESFADLSVIGELKTNEPLTPFVDSLTENTVKGYALSSVFGAKTPNSEWEFLAGGSMAFLPSGSVVYQQYLNDTPSTLVSTLKNEGYTCVAMHPYYETGWSRNLVYPDLGFDESYFMDHFDQSQMIREYISDEELYRKIIARYENRKVNEDLFIMSISMQNHGGYGTDYENFEENYYKIGRSYTDANQYFSLIRESDDALCDFVNYFRYVEEPVQIVFFGDHQPSLNRKFYEILNGKGLSGLTMSELEALYTVPFFIWTNYDTPEATIEITSLNFLSSLALERAGLDLPPYNQFMLDLMEVVPALNARGYYSLEKGKYLHIEEAMGKEALWLAKYKYLQYNGLFDVRNRSELFFPYIEE